jgi:hypothetical protein
MNNLFECDLLPDPDLDATENIFLVSIYIREEININSSFTLQIPKFIFESLNKSDFNWTSFFRTKSLCNFWQRYWNGIRLKAKILS